MATSIQFKNGVWKTCSCSGTIGAVAIPPGSQEVVLNGAQMKMHAGASGMRYQLMPNMVSIDVLQSDAVAMIAAGVVRAVTAADRSAMKGFLSRVGKK